ncbi:pilus assembly protein PilW [Vibrio sp. Y2-5]|uniref:pilus assembly protein PilW n=1 Tax=Vibrio sp. Y2-5 TaxID=2743977 RepID=UPI0016601F05|nr:pilus assembly protein PilW [Vibrio sp. Y2-5]MBD0788456.1 pilus assembly protein PilW [Vibrio sp. Y2-5]
MVTRSAIRKISGFSIVEFMVAALLGGIALTTMGSVLLSTQKSASEKSKQIMLLQNISSTLHQLKEDILRAGFDDGFDTSARFLGESKVTYVHSQPNALGYVYKVRSSTPPEYRHVLYWLNSKTSSLMFCEKSRPTLISVYSAATQFGNCYSVFDPNQISVNQFSVTRHQIDSDDVESAFVIVRMAAHLTKYPEINQYLELKVTQRNWQ